MFIRWAGKLYRARSRLYRATKYSFESSRLNLHNTLLCTTPNPNYEKAWEKIGQKATTKKSENVKGVSRNSPKQKMTISCFSSKILYYTNFSILSSFHWKKSWHLNEKVRREISKRFAISDQVIFFKNQNWYRFCNWVVIFKVQLFDMTNYAFSFSTEILFFEFFQQISV